MILVIVISLLFAGGGLFMQQPKFGKAPAGERLERMKKSPNFRDGKFHNLINTSVMKEGVNYFSVMKEFFFNKSSRTSPASALPSEKIDLLSLNRDENIIVWFGHSSYFMQIDGKRILVDPVLCGGASPVSFINKSYDGTNGYTPDDIPEIDYLIITHDHWDHLDYETLIRIKPKVKKVVTGLGVGAHIEYWGYDIDKISEMDWNDSLKLDEGFDIHATTARHFSGRGLKRDGTLWVSFVMKTPNMKIFISGDGGYGPHFKEIGSKYGPFDLAFLECGQYNDNWKYIHMSPEETVQASIDLKASKFLPIHWSKYSLSLHAWDESIKRVTAECKRKNVLVIHPMIGEKVNLLDSIKTSAWWESVE